MRFSPSLSSPFLVPTHDDNDGDDDDDDHDDDHDDDNDDDDVPY